MAVTFKVEEGWPAAGEGWIVPWQAARAAALRIIRSVTIVFLIENAFVIEDGRLKTKYGNNVKL
jgi:hypothetical protein